MTTLSTSSVRLVEPIAGMAALPTGRSSPPRPPPSSEEKTMMQITTAMRTVVAVAALATTAAVMLVVLAAFDGVSREPFLRDTPEARLAVARCEATGERAHRASCMRRLIAAAKASGAGAARVATLETEPRAR